MRKTVRNAQKLQRKGKKTRLLFPVIEKDDWISENDNSEQEVAYKAIGVSDTSQYKTLVEKIHKIYKERKIGSNEKTTYILSTEKLQNLIEEVEFLKTNRN